MARCVMGGAMLIMATISAACGEDPIEADPSVAPFVGLWEADSLTMTSDADTTMVDNLIAQGGFFTLSVEPSGQYTATIGLIGATSVEIGDLDVLASALQLNRTFPPPPASSVSTFVLVSDDFLILDGPSEYDFNRDGLPEGAQAHIELQRQ
jgi:hypothetical protein